MARRSGAARKLPAVTPDAPLVIEHSPVAPTLVPRGRRVRASSVTGYSGARARRATQDWFPATGGPNADTLPDLAALRGRSRDLERNAPLATGALQTLTTTTVGTGLHPQPRLDAKLLGITQSEADEWSRVAETLYWAHMGRPNCDVVGRDDFAGLQELAFRGVMGSGDAFVLRRYVKRPGDLFGLKLQLIEADRVSNPDMTPSTDRLMGGVELDEYGMATAYHVANRHPGELYGPGLMGGPLAWNRVAAYGAASGERQVLHLVRATRPGQMRGVPILASVVEMLKQLTRYTDSELYAAVVSSFFTVFVQSTDVEETGLPSDDPEGTVTLDDNEVGLGQGAVVTLAPGETANPVNPTRPNTAFDQFVLALLRQIGVALELPYEFLIKHFTASYSASQAALLEAWRAVVTRRAWLVRQLCQPVYEWLIVEAVSTGRLGAPGFFSDPLMRAAWCNAHWVGTARGQINPVQEVSAAKVRVDAGFSTIAQETAQLTGGDWEENHAQQVKERRARRRDGLDTESVAERVVTEPREPVPGTPDPPPAPPDDDTEDETRDEP